MPKVYVIPDMSPNAFATGRNPQHAAVAATEGILRLLSEGELEGVIAHELAHVQASRHPDQHRRGDDGGGDHDAGQHGAVRGDLWRQPRRSRRRQSDRAARHGDTRADCRHADPGRDLTSAGVRGRSPRRRHRGHADRSRAGAAADRGHVQTRAARCQSGDGAHVHHAPVFGQRIAVALLDTSADGRPDSGAAGRADFEPSGAAAAVVRPATLPRLGSRLLFTARVRRPVRTPGTAARSLRAAPGYSRSRNAKKCSRAPWIEVAPRRRRERDARLGDSRQRPIDARPRRGQTRDERHHEHPRVDARVHELSNGAKSLAREAVPGSRLDQTSSSHGRHAHEDRASRRCASRARTSASRTIIGPFVTIENGVRRPTSTSRLRRVIR